MSIYELKKRYIHQINETFQPLTDFGGIGYAHVYATGAEYVKIHNSTGGSEFLDVTGHDLEQILLEVISVVIGNKPPCVVKEKTKKREIQGLFSGVIQ